MSELVAFTGGGTGGHVFPGLAVANRLAERRPVEVVWIGSSTGMERHIVEDAGIEYHGLPSGKLRRYFSLQNVVDLFKVAVAIICALFLLRRLRPALLFSKGGFVSVPPVIAAHFLGIPVISHESDLDPGLATRINARFSDSVLVAYEQTRQMLPGALSATVIATGNPVRPEILSGSRDRGLEIARFTKSDVRPVVFFLGGSLGAIQINELVGELLPRLRNSWRVVHQTGDPGRQGPNELDSAGSSPGYCRAPFFAEQMRHLLACSDVLVCRAGASTLWEGGVLGKPMILVPLIDGSRGDQVRNASIFEEAGAALVFTNPESLAADVADALQRLATNADMRGEMGRCAMSIAHGEGTDQVVGAIERVLEE